jgi:hypothetical protein
MFVLFTLQEVHLNLMQLGQHIVRKYIYLEDLYNATTKWIDSSTMNLIKSLIARERLLELDLIEGSIFGGVERVANGGWVITSGNLHMIQKIYDVLVRGHWPHPVDLLADGRELNATDPRDKIYGFMGLVDPSFARKLTPDYKRPVEQVYTDFSIALMQADQCLNLLSL